MMISDIVTCKTVILQFMDFNVWKLLKDRELATIQEPKQFNPTYILLNLRYLMFITTMTASANANSAESFFTFLSTSHKIIT